MSEPCETTGIMPAILTIQVISQRLVCPIRMTVFLVGGLSPLRAAVIAAAGEINAKGRCQRCK